jgi:hypothetical protein
MLNAIECIESCTRTPNYRKIYEICISLFTVLKINMIFIGICGRPSNLAACVYSYLAEPTPLELAIKQIKPNVD